MALNFDILKTSTPLMHNTNVVYQDLHLDIAKKYTKNDQLQKKNEITDIVADVNANAIKNSIYNILSTIPGQKLLNPGFGLNFTQWVFTNMSETNANLIQNKIFNHLARYEPRITVNEITVTPQYETHEYNIMIKYNNNETFQSALSETGLTI